MNSRIAFVWLLSSLGTVWSVAGAQQQQEPGSAAAQPEQEPIETLPVEPLRAEPAPADRAAAQEPDDSQRLDTIEVTAGKRRQTLRDIPGSVSALRGEELEKMKAQSLGDYLKRVPGVILVDRGPDNVQPVIRGISTSTGALGTQFTQLPVGIYVDDMPFTDLYVPLSQPDLNPFDLERVEVLKGPQGTLFGSGALSGAIRYILQKPKTSIWEAKLSATVSANRQGEDLSPVYGAALNVPLFGDQAALRIVGVARENTGMIDEPEQGQRDVDKLDQGTGRVLGHWNVSDKFKLNGFYFLQDTDQNNTPNADNPRDFSRTSGDGQTVRESGFNGGNLVASYAFDWGDVISSSNYLEKDVVNTGLSSLSVLAPMDDPDGDGGENGLGTEDVGQNLLGFINSQSRGLFQELRVASPEGGDWEPFDDIAVKWLFGAAYQRTLQDVQQFSAVAALIDGFGQLAVLPILPLPTPLGPLYGTRETSVIYAELYSKAQETAIFGEATAALGESWEATLGARLFRTHLRATGFLTGAQIIALDPGSLSVPFDRTIKENGVNPKISLRYEFNDQVQAYVLAAEGFQFGGVQLNPPLAAFTATVPDSFVPYKSSHLWNYEIGLRTEFFERRLKWDITAFYLDWKDLQITLAKPLVPMGEDFNLTAGFTENIGRATSRGVETALSISPLPGFDFTSSVAWIQAVTAEDFDSAAGFVPKNTRLPSSPRFQMANVLSYTTGLDVLGGWESSFGLTHAHVGSSFSDLQYRRMQGGYDTLDASVALLKTGWSFVPEISATLINLTDVRGVSAVSVPPDERDIGYFFIRPRTAVLSLSIKF